MAAAAASNAVEDRLLDSLSAEQRLLLLFCCCCGQTVREPVLLRCLHGCCSSCAMQLGKEENERETSSGGATSAHAVRAAGAKPTPAPQSSLAGQSTLTAAEPGGREVKPALPAALCRSCGEPLLLASGGAERRNYFLASLLHSQLIKEQCKGRQLVPSPPALPPCDTCKNGGDGSAAAAASRHRCEECRLNLCDSCVHWHNVFRNAHQASLSPLPLPWQGAPRPAPACSAHGGRPCNAVCLTCTRAMCDLCAWACRDHKHDVRDVADDDRRRVIDTDVVKAAEARRKDVLSNRTSLCDQLSLLVERQKKAILRREKGAREAREALAARRRSLFAAIDRAHDALGECCRCPGAPSLHLRNGERRDAAAPASPVYGEAATLDRNVRHLLAYSEAFASLSDDLVLLEQHEIVTARLTMLKKDLEAATTAADSACEESSDEERRLRQLARAAPAGDDELLEAVARLCLLGRVQQLQEVLRNSSGNALSGNGGSGGESSSGGGSSRRSGGSSDGSSGLPRGTAVDRWATMQGDSCATRSADGALVVQRGTQSQQSVLRSDNRFNGEVAGRTLQPPERASAAASSRPTPAEAVGLKTREVSSAGTSSKLPASSASRSAAATVTAADAGPGVATAAGQQWSPYNPMQLGYPRSRFRTKTPCLGLTFTADGNLLLAAGEEGLLEFTPDGPLVGGWRPPQPGNYVVGAAALGDGRVAVILRDSQSLSLLRRKRRANSADGGSGDSWIRGHSGDRHDRNRIRGTRWTLDRQVPLQLVSRFVAACGLLVAAVGGPNGRRLLMVSLADDDCVLLMNRELECAALGLALTPRLLVFLSEVPEQHPTAGGDVPAGSGDRPCVVHGHCYSAGGEDDSSDGKLPWSTVCNHWASDVCASPCGHIVYVALPYADRVLALASADGSSLTAILSAADGWTLRKPSWLVVWQGIRRGAGAADSDDGIGDDRSSATTSHGKGVAVTASSVAAMLSTDLHSVSVFPVIREASFATE